MKLSSLIAGLVVCMPMSIAAHHSWTADYDGGKPVTVKGVVTKVEWTNPHTHFYVEAKDEKGAVTLWNFEMASTLSLERGGWTRKTLPVGTEVTVGGFGGRAVLTRAIAGSITTADGKALFVGKPPTTTPQNYNVNFNAGTFGRITTQAGSPRIIQFGFKYDF